MKARPYKFDGGKTYEPCEPAEATHIKLRLPGPVGEIMLPIIGGNATRAGTGRWSWNGDTEKPTLKPSLLSKGTHQLSDDEYERIMAGAKVRPRPFRCHSWVTNGKVNFLPDSDHSLRGQTVDLLEVGP